MGAPAGHRGSTSRRQATCDAEGRPTRSRMMTRTSRGRHATVRPKGESDVSFPCRQASARTRVTAGATGRVERASCRAVTSAGRWRQGRRERGGGLLSEDQLGVATRDVCRDGSRQPGRVGWVGGREGKRRPSACPLFKAGGQPTPSPRGRERPGDIDGVEEAAEGSPCRSSLESGVSSAGGRSQWPLTGRRSEPQRATE